MKIIIEFDTNEEESALALFELYKTVKDGGATGLFKYGDRDVNIELLPFSVRTTNILKRVGLFTLKQLIQHTRDEIIKLGVSKRCIDEVDHYFREYSLNYKIPSEAVK